MMTEERKKELELEILAALGGITAEDRVWRAITASLDYWQEQETDAALAPNLSSEARHYNAGRAANTEAVREFLGKMFARAQEAKAKRLDKQGR